jgi:hypothetical protein
MDEVITKEFAEEEFTRWFEAKRLPNSLLDKNQDDKEAIISAIQDGRLYLNENNEFIQKLLFPVETGSQSVSELKYRFRVSEGELAASTRGVKPDDLIGQLSICYISTLTGLQKGIIRSLDPADSLVGKKIAAFFFI